jgi:ABC-type transport system involved in cytochrome c biogenesis ATPase subunit
LWLLDEPATALDAEGQVALPRLRARISLAAA